MRVEDVVALGRLPHGHRPRSPGETVAAAIERVRISHRSGDARGPLGERQLVPSLAVGQAAPPSRSTADDSRPPAPVT
jgi:hypothetical protein